MVVEGDILGLIHVLKYVNHNITYEKNFLELVHKKFLINSISSETHMIVIEPHMWAIGLQKVGLINLFIYPTFDGSRRLILV